MLHLSKAKRKQLYLASMDEFLPNWMFENDGSADSIAKGWATIQNQFNEWQKAFKDECEKAGLILESGIHREQQENFLMSGLDITYTAYVSKKEKSNDVHTT